MAGKKPAVGKLTPAVCEECEQSIQFGYSAMGLTRLEPSTIVDPVVERTLWAVGVPTYAVVRNDKDVQLVLRTPATDAPPVDEVAIAHLCDGGNYQAGRVLRCPEWYGHSKYVVASVDRSIHVLRASELGEIYQEVSRCSSVDAAWTRVQILRWRDRARQMR